MVDSQSVKNTSEEGINLFLAITFNKNEVKQWLKIKIQLLF